ncbi:MULTISPECIES: DivIVA domain-containing protein [unclassified Streptomyces]|uniref:DivIVA domain-containing protein n=1 Tax=unclassified Streptomyces TaxID=2593676 RepID=UPI00225B9C8E|nr:MULTISPECIES: cell division initiation protein [unclassified Streptomyces]MCX5051324.1 cell division initiation protein [Streptomyces sp. NBC_00474]MCX5061659.1 cell division initiation protein [Streptomyces sp. NBC_00452]MCX5249210.1 cell division initiation protein [Streptomyces sp. NBC_00201]MCX5292727.1 cell division initiation protein [Streptomyces sp. NBC_00183]
MDVQKKLDEIVAAVSSARAMPMSASCVINRADLLAQLEEVRAALPDSLAQAQELIGGREEMVEQARQEADRIIGQAHAERGSLISDTEVARRSQAEADRILTEARQEAEEVRAEADDYVDSKLANFEVVLTKTLGSVGRGREKLLGTGPGVDEQGYEDEDAPERSHDPETLRKDADAYVDVKLGAFEAVLAKTLEAVGRGRQKLHGRIATDDLGALADDASALQHSSDADYLSDLAALTQQETTQAEQSAQQRAYTEPQPAYGYQQQTDPYAGGYQQQGYGGQDAYGYQQADPYAYQGYDAQQAAYDPNQGQQAHQGQQGHQAHQDHQAYALDETSLFDTGMITPEQLRAYEQGRGQ